MAINQAPVLNYADLNHKRLEDGAMPGAWWHVHPDSDRIDCTLCPRECSLKPGDRGFCFVRENRDGRMVLSTYGKSTGFCIDPIEKKPLNHFFPGTSVLSFGTAGCNLGCKFCQNWDISKSREVERLSARAEPETIAVAAMKLGCHSVAFTYNDPIVWAEYAIDSAKACRAQGVRTVAVTAGYISAEARAEFFAHMDAANVDLKAFSEEFYHKITYSHLQPVLDTLVYLKRETDVWFEITNLVIPGANDSLDELRKMCGYLADNLGDDVPLHFSAFHPDFRMRDRPNTPPETLRAAYDIARAAGLKYVYVGNIHDVERQSTYCGSCGQLLVQRDWYQLGIYRLKYDRCSSCKAVIPGRFGDGPGTWGSKRLPVQIERFAKSTALPTTNSVTARSINPNVVEMPSLGRAVNSEINSPQKDAAMTSVNSNVSRPAVAPAVFHMPKLNQAERAQIQKAACQWTIESVLRRQLSPAEQLLGDLANTVVMGVFVTLKRGHTLRGCCGVLARPMQLGVAISSAALRTATDDQRMSPISPSELPYLDVGVTWLGPMEPIDAAGAKRADAIEIGRHGIVIQSGQASGLLLPSVATENGWDAPRFLQAVCRKAGLPTSAWLESSAAILRFEGESVSEKLPASLLTDVSKSVRPPLTEEELQGYCNLAGTNIMAIAQGATPNYYAPGLPDMNVNALVLSLQWTDKAGDMRQANALQVSVRPGVALQSTLFQMCQSVAHMFNRQQFSGELQLGLSIGIDPAMHGYGDSADLEGFDASRRALFVSDARHCAIAFDPARSAQELLASLRQSLPIGSRDCAVHSVDVVTTMPRLLAISSPQPVRGSGSRMPAVAGTFYPAEDAARRALVDSLCKGPEPEKRAAAAIMVPHAGLKYSGRVAADGWRNAQLPDRLLIISPKHTAAGVNWAVCPLDRWKISSTTSISGDAELAQRIADCVPGMQLDVAAHEGEHGIEVQLPLLEKIAPNSKVVGIAMHGGSWSEIQSAAKSLAQMLKEMENPPLLVISSDMNHYASDEENRRLDRLALDAFASGDPQRLLATCRENEISMCGVIPAALVLETLRALGRDFHVSEISYATSGDVSGDRSRVVGYASSLLV